jgi:hypothetical protein
MVIVLRIVKREMMLRYRLEYVINVGLRNIIWNNVILNKKELLLLSVLFVKKWGICLKSVHRLQMESFTKEEVVISVGPISIRNLIVQKEVKNRTSMNSTSKIFKKILFLF